MAHPEIKPLDIIRARFPQAARHGDPTVPADTPHPVLVLRVIHEANGTTWILGAFGTSQGTEEKLGDPCDPYEIDIEADNKTKLDKQTRFKIKKHAPIQYNETWCPLAGLKQGRLPEVHHAAVQQMIDECVPSAMQAATPLDYREKSKPVVLPTRRSRGTPPTAPQAAVAPAAAPAQQRQTLSLRRPSDDGAAED